MKCLYEQKHEQVCTRQKMMNFIPGKVFINDLNIISILDF